jgi:hypothetical protein
MTERALADTKCIFCRPDPVTQAKIWVTRFNDAAAAIFSASEMSLPELREAVLTTTATTKDQLPWLKLAEFGNERTSNNSLRHNANVTAISGVETDYDTEVMSLEEAIAIVDRARLLALMYTSPSHTAAKPRWRIVLPTSRSMAPNERAKLVARVNGLFGGIFDDASFTLSQAFTSAVSTSIQNTAR